MFFRFGATVMLIVAVSLFGIALDKRMLSLKRSISLQHYRAEQLEEQDVRLRLRIQELGAPARLIEAIESGRLNVRLLDRSPAELSTVFDHQ